MKISGTEQYFGAYLEKTNGFSKFHFWGANGAAKVTQFKENLSPGEKEFHVDTSVDRFESSKDLPPMMTDTEIKEFLYSPLSRKRLIEKYGEDDQFGINGNQQWTIFSKKLYDTGFFDNMTESQLLEMDDVLRHITSAMDSFNLYGSDDYWALGCSDAGNYLYNNSVGIHSSDYHYMTEKDWQAQLISATEALHSFCETFVPEDVKTEFNNLIQEFYNFNAAQLTNYQSPFEKSGTHYMSGYGDDHAQSEPAAKEPESSFIYAPPQKNNDAYLDTLKEYFNQLANLKGSQRQHFMDQSPLKGNHPHSTSNLKNSPDNIKEYWNKLTKLEESCKTDVTQKQLP